jgi:hypothetical protein
VFTRVTAWAFCLHLQRAMTSPRYAILAFAAACASNDLDLLDTAPLTVTSISPQLGSVAGGTRVTITGTGLARASVTIGGVACASTSAESTSLSCMTGDTDFHEGTVDVSVTRGDERVELRSAFTFECPWTTTGGRRTCGAVPPGQVTPQTISAWVTQFQAQHGFVVDTALASMAETTDFVLGSQSIWLDTNGAGAVTSVQRRDMTAFDFRDHMFKIWVKIDNVAHLSALDVWLGDSGFRNVFKFRLRSTQGQQWMTEGDWVAFTVPWAGYAVSGSPDRGAITDVMIRAADDASGHSVRVHLNGLALVPEPVERFPNGVVSFTFDDNWASQVHPAADILGAHGFAATMYTIIDTVDKKDRATLADLHALHDAGWDIAAHANTDLHHFARFPTLPAEVLEDDVVDMRAWLIANGFKGYDHCAYPGGEFTGVLDITGRYFETCRTIFEKQQESFPPSDARKLRVLLVTAEKSLATVKQAVDDACANREWLILVFHKIVDGGATSNEWPRDRFEALVDHVDGTHVPVKPISAVVD